jgi:hypothetical protein
MGYKRECKWPVEPRNSQGDLHLAMKHTTGGNVFFYLLIFVKFRAIFAPFVIIFGALKWMPGLLKEVPFSVAFRAAKKVPFFAEKIGT